MRVDRARVGRYGRAAARWGRLLATRPPRGDVRVFYGHDRVPGPDDAAAGGTAKMQRLATRFPNSPAGFNLLYLGSTWLPRDLRPLLRLARRRGIPVVLNQNGVAYPAWAGERAEALNRPNRLALRAAGHVLYQSEFCKRSADEHLGPPPAGWEVLPNAVDVERFTPAASPPAGGPILLAGGDQVQGDYRLELALRTVAHLVREHPQARLLVSGRLLGDPAALVAELGLGGHVELLGRYRQADAPALFRRAHLLLHTQMNDSCPSVVLEAMACGLPVVHPASGGTVELVGGEAGIGVPHEASWERLVPPEPEALADAVGRVLEALPAYATAARARAVERYALGPWLDRHAALFARLVER
ncbi:MAG TPA: glycosyltransferase family 4 protein [Gaiellaceae bacterium]|nr:glycosyltransferase family 4 protein [Gaiellaceae bacterium]